MRRNGLFSFVHDEIDADKIFFDLVPMGFFKSKYVEAQGRGVHIRTSVHGEAGVMYVIVPCYKQKQAKKFALARDFVIFSFLVPFQILMGNFQVPKSLFLAQCACNKCFFAFLGVGSARRSMRCLGTFGLYAVLQHAQ